MLTPGTIEAAARAFLEAHRSRTRYRPLDPVLRAGPLEDAYRIQDALHRLMAEAGRGEIAGWKIALTPKAMQQMTGVDQPAAGAIFSMAVHPSPARIDLAGYHHLGVEFEVAVRLADDLPAGGAPWTRASVAGHVAACLPAFELVEDGDADYKTLDAFTLVPRTPGTRGSSSGHRRQSGAASTSSARRRAAGSTIGLRARARPATPWAIPSKPSRGSRTCSTVEAAFSIEA